MLMVLNNQSINAKGSLAFKWLVFFVSSLEQEPVMSLMTEFSLHACNIHVFMDNLISNAQFSDERLWTEMHTLRDNKEFWFLLLLTKINVLSLSWLNRKYQGYLLNEYEVYKACWERQVSEGREFNLSWSPHMLIKQAVYV